MCPPESNPSPNPVHDGASVPVRDEDREKASGLVDEHLAPPSMADVLANQFLKDAIAQAIADARFRGIAEVTGMARMLAIAQPDPHSREVEALDDLIRAIRAKYAQVSELLSYGKSSQVNGGGGQP